MRRLIQKKHYFIYHLLGIAISIAFFNGLETLLYKAMPMSFWVEYSNVAPADDYVIGEELTIISYAKYKRPVNAKWTDAIRCDCENNHINSCDNTGFYIYSTYESSADNHFPQSQTQAWNYQRNKPKHQTLCHIRSTTTIYLPHGVTKQQTIIGDSFNVVPASTKGLEDFVSKGARFTFDDGLFLLSIVNTEEYTKQDIIEFYGDKETDFKKYLLER